MKPWLNRFFLDKSGHLGVIQWPNLPLGLYLASLLVGLASHGTLKTTSQVIGFGALAVWAGLEIGSGVSLFRRVLGVIVLIVMIFNLIIGIVHK